MSGSFKHIAPYYDILMDHVDYAAWVIYLGAIFERFEIEPRKILDLACGTGVPTLLLARQGYEVIGLDNSMEMLKEAQKKTKGQTTNSAFRIPSWILGDMRSFEISEKVDVVISFFDSLNYLLEEEELRNTFNSVFRALVEGGYFIFDMNTIFGLSQYWSKGTDVRDENGLLSVWRNSFNRRQKIAQLDLTLFVHKESSKTGVSPVYERIDEFHEERGYSPREIELNLIAAGFQDINIFKHLKFQVSTRTTNRIMVVAKKNG
jgi:ubiquinone/menaquinone biosynthesis C-methylase UbiE